MRTVLQISDVHLTAGGGAHQGRHPETGLRSVLTQVGGRGPVPEVLVATGDLADDGSPEAYERLGGILTDLGLPAYCLAGNHDSEPTMGAVLPRPGVHLTRRVRLPPWTFLFLDTNLLGRMRVGVDAGGAGPGRIVDAPDRHVRAARGAIDPADLGWLDHALESAADPHVFVWLHHPPLIHPRYATGPTDLYTDLAAVFARHGNVRGVGAGHLHSGYAVEQDGVTYYACPSTWVAYDFSAGTTEAPGYRWYRLHDDGRIESEHEHIHDAAERAPLPAWLPKMLVEHM